jgi:hypothetical protein
MVLPELAKRFSALCGTFKVHYRLHKIPPIAPILSQINAVPISLSYFSQISFNIILLFTHAHSPSDFPTKTMYAPLIFPICTICPTHLILSNLIVGIISDGSHKT